VILFLLASALAAGMSGQVTELGRREVVENVQIWVGSQSFSATPDGRFQVDLPDGQHRVEFRAEGYKPVFLDVTLPVGRPIKVVMEPSDGPLEVVIEARRDAPHGSFQVLDRERVERTPGTHDDPGRLIQALPGVASTPEYSPRSGDISIRGAAPGDSRFYLDGVELPYLFHFQQYASVFHTRLLETVSIYPSTFNSEYGDAIGGIVEATSRSPELAESFHGGAAANLIMGSVWMQTPSAEEGGLAASARRSYADLMEHSSEWYTIWPTFWDYFARANRVVGDQRIGLTIFGAGDKHGRYVQQPENLGPLEKEANPPFLFDRAFHVASLRHDSDFGSLLARGNFAVVQDDWGGSLPSASQKRLEHYLWLREDLNWRHSPAFELVGGVQAKAQWVKRWVDTDRAWIELSGDAPLLARGVAVDERLSRVNGGVYVEPRLHLGDWRLQIGGRMGFDTAVGSAVIDPRLSWRWRGGENLGFRGAVGQYSQAPELDQLSPEAGDPDLGFAQSQQVSVGGDVVVVGRLEFGLDLWAKRMRNVLLQEAGEAPRAVDGHAWGVEFSSRYRLRERFFTWLSLNVGESVRDGKAFDFDQPFAINFVSSWSFSPKWTAGLRYRYSAGLPYTPISHGLYDGNTDSYLPVADSTNSARLPDYQKVDVRIERAWRFSQWSLAAYLEIWYVPSANNSMYVVSSYDYSQQVFVSGPSFVPLVGLRGEL
jgi:hypothetical protein